MDKISLSIQHVAHENVTYEKLEIPLSDFRSDGKGSIRGKNHARVLFSKKKKRKDVNTENENHRCNSEKFISKIVLRISKLPFVRSFHRSLTLLAIPSFFKDFVTRTTSPLILSHRLVRGTKEQRIPELFDNKYLIKKREMKWTPVANTLVHVNAAL